MAEFHVDTAALENKKKIDDIVEAAGGKEAADMPAVVLKIFMASKDREPDEVVNEMRRLQLSRGLDDSQKVKVLLEALFDFKDPKTIHTQYAAQAPILTKFCSDRKQATILIGCIEEQVRLGMSAKN